MGTLEHVVPKSRGGSNDISNLRIACLTCNVAKNDWTYTEVVLGFKLTRETVDAIHNVEHAGPEEEL